MKILQLTDTAATAAAINRSGREGLRAAKRGTEMGLRADVVVFPPLSKEYSAAERGKWLQECQSASTRVTAGGFFVVGEVRW